MISAKVRLGSKIPYSRDDAETVQLSFYADYNDAGRNEEWAKFTPSLNLNMMVKPSVADKFVQGQAYTLYFEENNE